MINQWHMCGSSQTQTQSFQTNTSADKILLALSDLKSGNMIFEGVLHAPRLCAACTWLLTVQDMPLVSKFPEALWWPNGTGSLCGYVSPCMFAGGGCHRPNWERETDYSLLGAAAGGYALLFRLFVTLLSLIACACCLCTNKYQEGPNGSEYNLMSTSKLISIRGLLLNLLERLSFKNISKFRVVF